MKKRQVKKNKKRFVVTTSMHTSKELTDFIFRPLNLDWLKEFIPNDKQGFFNDKLL